MTLMYLWKIIPIMKSTNIYLKKQSIVTLESILSHSAIGFVVTQEEWALDVQRLPITDFSCFLLGFYYDLLWDHFCSEASLRLCLLLLVEPLCASETTALAID